MFWQAIGGLVMGGILCPLCFADAHRIAYAMMEHVKRDSFRHEGSLQSYITFAYQLAQEHDIDRLEVCQACLAALRSEIADLEHTIAGYRMGAVGGLALSLLSIALGYGMYIIHNHGSPIGRPTYDQPVWAPGNAQELSSFSGYTPRSDFNTLMMSYPARRALRIRHHSPVHSSSAYMTVAFWAVCGLYYGLHQLDRAISGPEQILKQRCQILSDLFAQQFY